MGVPVDTFDPYLWGKALDALAIQNLPYDVHYILNQLEYVGYDISQINQTQMFELLSSVDYDNFVLDRYVLENQFLPDLGIDPSTFDQTLWQEVLMELEIYEMPYEVHYILELLEYVGYDVSTIDQQFMFSILNETDWTNFVLDTTVLEDFFNQLGIDSSTFDQIAWEEVKAELEIIDLPYEVHYILDLLERVGVDTT